MQNSRKTKSSIILRLAILVFSIYLIVTFCVLWGQLIDSKNAKNEGLAQVDELNNKISAKIDELEGSHSEIIEKEARRLGYAYPDEQVYTNDNGIN